MKKLLGIVVVLILLLALCVMPSSGVFAVSSTATITITATGSEIDISVAPTSWSIGTVHASDNKTTALNAYNLTSAGSEDVDVTIAGRSMKDTVDGLQKTWALSNTATPGAAIFGMKAGLDGGSWSIVILNVGQTLEKLVDELATGIQGFGLNFLAPSSSLDNYEMEMVGSTGATGDADRGILLTGSID